MSIRTHSRPRLTAAAFFACLALIGGSLVFAAPASAGPGGPNLPGATDAVYPLPVAGQGFAGDPSSVAGEAATGTPSDPGSATTASTGGGLPFTGMSAAVMLAVGLVALLAGFALRRFSNSLD
jgi:hypothetical protein